MPRLVSCEDEDEARGIACVLERAGILVALRESGDALAIDVERRDELRAKALLGRLANAHAHKLVRDRSAHRSQRERFVVRAALGLLVVAIAIWLAA